jgi:hypothetical protein
LSNKIVSIKKTSSIFLATVLVLGTLATIFPSFMTGAQAVPEYGMERDYKKSDKKDVSVKNVKCNNINVNVNGLELNLTSVPFLRGLLASEAHEGERGASSFGSGQSGYDNNSFKFICINNNNNTVVVGEEPPTPVDECSEAEEIEACFEEFLFEGDFLTLVAALESGITIGINGEEVTLRSFNDICLAFEGLTTYQQLMEAVDNILIDADVSPGEGFFAVVNCIAEAIGIPIPQDNI